METTIPGTEGNFASQASKATNKIVATTATVIVGTLVLGLVKRVFGHKNGVTVDSTDVTS